jgi:hypothetical protein
VWKSPKFCLKMMDVGEDPKSLGVLGFGKDGSSSFCMNQENQKLFIERIRFSSSEV